MRILQLDNPVWHALIGPHQYVARRVGDVTWYPAAIAPFVSVPDAEGVPDLDAAHTLGFGDSGYFLGVCPARLPKGWRYVARSTVLQLLPPAAGPEVGATPLEMRELTAGCRAQMFALAKLAFPDFFRERTPELGEYLGFFDAGNLVAMAGERLAMGEFQEISGVCTHPGYSGRGLARRLTALLLARHRARGVQSFLHVSEGNSAARRLYESLGFVLRARLDLGKIERHEEP